METNRTLVAELRDLREDAQSLLGELRYTQRHDGQNCLSQTDAGAEVDRRTRELAAKTGRTYSEAMAIVLNEDPDLKEAFARHPSPASRRDSRRSAVRFSDGSAIRRDNFRGEQTPGDKIHTLVKALRAKHPALSYAAAYRAVLADPQNAELKEAYAMTGAA